MKIKIGNYILNFEKQKNQISKMHEIENDSISNDKNFVMIIILLYVFATGFLVGKATYDNRPISQEEYYENNKLEYYE